MNSPVSIAVLIAASFLCGRLTVPTEPVRSHTTYDVVDVDDAISEAGNVINAGGQSSTHLNVTLLICLMVFGIFYVFVIVKPAQRHREEMERLQGAALATLASVTADIAQHSEVSAANSTKLVHRQALLTDVARNLTASVREFIKSGSNDSAMDSLTAAEALLLTLTQKEET